MSPAEKPSGKKVAILSPDVLKNAREVSVTEAWKEWARRELARLPRGTRAKVCLMLGISTGRLTELLGKRQGSSKLIPFVERALVELGARPLASTRYAGMISHLVATADDNDRELLMDAAELLLTDGHSEQRKALIAMLRSFRAARLGTS